MNAIEIKNLTKVYGKNRGIQDINISVKEGEIYGFIGPNGAGKSTTIKTLLNFIYSTSGEALIFGMDSVKESEKIKEYIGYVPSEVRYYDDVKVKDIIKYAQSFYPKSNKEYVDRICNELELDMNKKMGELSLGNKKKVAIAQSLINNPKLLILDEPTAGLDPKGRDDILGQIAKLQKERGITIVLVSHSMEDVAQYASRILVVNGGKIVFDDKPRKVFEHEKELNEMGLAIPQVTQLMHRLKSEGYPVFENAITVQEARKNLLMYFQGKKKQDCKSKDQNNQDQKSQIESRRKPEEKTV